jgi:import receptor subunit TOM70
VDVSLHGIVADVTAVCILESFHNQHSVLVADRVLKELGKQKAQEAYKVFRFS